MASLLTSIVIVFLLCHSGKVEWSTLIGPDLSRYFDLIGHDTAVKTQLKSQKVPYYGRFLPSAVSLWHKDGFPARKGSIIYLWSLYESLGPRLPHSGPRWSQTPTRHTKCSGIQAGSSTPIGPDPLLQILQEYETEYENLEKLVGIYVI